MGSSKVCRYDTIQRYEACTPPEEQQRLEGVTAVRIWVLAYLMAHPSVTLDTVYCAKTLNCRDGDMYDAFEELLAEGLIRGPRLADVSNHADAEYRLAERKTT